ncbi:hypothetical protein HDU87_004397 [Geranomyces variabilis]|uniref:Cytochrome b561 domain-containing protein n=1 Tax=Geranomyces variabilis TaxID=109894 RepID=A0AAD5XS09_9FUNG|nr:hypothetical protein HDU87_004397 [Geranomyces variabilis]
MLSQLFRLVAVCSALCALASSVSSAQAAPLCFGPAGSTACVSSSQAPDGRALIHIQYPPSLGWVAFGIGKSMSSADVMLAYATGSTVTVGRRTASRHALPTLEATQNLEIVSSSVNQTINTVTFYRPLAPAAAGSANAITPAAQSLIWAVREGAAPTSPTGITQHSSFGTATGNLLDGSMTQNAPASSAGGSPSSAAGPVVSGSQDDGNSEKLVKAHGLIMGIAWGVLAPAAVLIARFGKAAMGVWWFRVHAGIFAAVVILTYVAFVLVYESIGSDGTHFSVSDNGAHVILGLIVLILAAPQALLGIIIDRLYNPERKATPFHDLIHHHLGRLTLLVALVNIPLGIALYYRDAPGSPTWAYVLFALAMAFTIVAWAVLERRWAMAKKGKNVTHGNLREL